MRDVNAFLTLKQSEGAPGQIEEWAKLEENYNKKYVSFIECLKVYVLNCLCLYNDIFHLITSYRTSRF